MESTAAIDLLVTYSRQVSEGDVPAPQVLELLADALRTLRQVGAVVLVETGATGRPQIVTARGIEICDPLEVDSVDEELERAMLDLASGRFKRAYTLPLVSAGGLFGAAVLLWNGEGVDPVEVRVVEGLVDLAAVALDRAHRAQTLHRAIEELHERRVGAARREKLEALGKMAAVVAHEVKNPLASISGALQVLGQRMASDSTDGRIVDMVVQRLRDLNSMVDELLVFARPRSLTLSRVPLARLLRGVAGLVSANPKWASLDLRVTVEPPEAELLVDAGQLQGVLLNLLLNAAQASGGEGVVELVGTLDGPRANIMVTDDGPGVVPELRERIFDPFFTTRTRGSGLGLAVARQVVEAHGGTISLHCPETGGARFVLALPN